ncbi:MAG: hypothetical protein KKD64_11370 [Alphaproteobacteria bacterium]|nr:hypothetical protein [Alphaproteobacteria bacterium]MBU0794057.1 hypothetical protein [Alphaproteobacteria bacterium]MBU0877374.1 hypothetical protein [Alphaproteobacteria bacterium]MBU1770241.1 hypothetical protein [Alphaproteobacteria bacterium]
MTDNFPESAPADDIAEAFEALRGEVSLTRRAVEGLTAAREHMPDYSATLGKMAEALKQAAEGIDRVERSPAVRLSPAAMADEIRKAGTDARAEDHALLSATRDALMRSIGCVDGIVERGRAADQQLRRVIWAGVGGALGGTLLMAILPGAIARSLPESWHVPEWMAARTIGLDQRAAGERMIATSADEPDADDN